MSGKIHLKYEYNGEMLSIKELMAYSAVKEPCLRKRLKKGMDINKALNEEAHHIEDPISVGKVNAEVSRHNRKSQKFELFARCTARCNPKS